MKLFHISLVAAALSFSTAHAQIRIGGSDLLAPHVQTVLVEYAEVRGLEVEVSLTGSYYGLERLRQGELDLSIVAVPPGAEVPSGEFRSVRIASKVVTVAVAPSNPLNQVTQRQLAGIFAEGEPTAPRWGQVGLTGEWAARTVAPGAITPVRHSLALDLFRHTALQGRGLRRTLAYYEDVAAVRRRFEQDNSGIVILHRIPESLDGLKILAVAGGEDAIAHRPTLETVAADEYSLRLPLYAVFPVARAGEVGEILRYLVGDEATEAIMESGLAPLPALQRQRLAFEFERL